LRGSIPSVILIASGIVAGVTNIGNYAFGGCTNLLSVTFAGTIASASFNTSNPFPGDLRTKYFANPGGGAGTYTRPNSSSTTWTKS